MSLQLTNKVVNALFMSEFILKSHYFNQKSNPASKTDAQAGELHLITIFVLVKKKQQKTYY